MVTSVQEEFERTRQECLAALAADPDAKLRRRFRYALKISMGPASYVPGSRPRQGVATPGLLRRTRLLELSARKVLPVWDKIVGTPDPRQLLDLANDYLAGRADFKTLDKRQNSFGGSLLDAGSLPPGKRFAIYVGHAAVDMALNALMDDDMTLDDEEDEDQDSWDGPFNACAAWSGEYPWEPASDKAKRLEFWKWWLETAAPEAFAAFK